MAKHFFTVVVVVAVVVVVIIIVAETSEDRIAAIMTLATLLKQNPD